MKQRSMLREVLNPGDCKLLQKLLPLFPADVTRINELVGFARRSRMVYYFNYQMLIYHYHEQDIPSFKVLVCQLYLQGNATSAEIRQSFGLKQKKLGSWIKVFQEEGPAGFYLSKTDESDPRVEK